MVEGVDKAESRQEKIHHDNLFIYLFKCEKQLERSMQISNNIFLINNNYNT